MKINEIKEEIKTKLKKIIKDFPEICIRYEYKDDSNYHFIEITPSVIFHFDKKLKKVENDFNREFISNFPNHVVCFISNDSIVSIENSEFEIVGEKYIDKNSKNTNSKYKKIVAKKSKKEIHHN